MDKPQKNTEVLKHFLKVFYIKLLSRKAAQLADPLVTERHPTKHKPITIGVSKGRWLRGFLTKIRLRTVSLWGCVGLASSSSFSAPLWPPVSEELGACNDKET